MPRAERPLDSDDGALTHFAAGLRLLRSKAGSPGYRELAARAHYSSTTLADAAAGRKLPSLPVTLAYVRACGGDPAEWEARWREVAAELAVAQAQQPAPVAGDGPESPYVGLAAFQPEDAERFFGRENLTDELVSRVRAGRFLAVFGASGSGKSSLLRAGLLPRIRTGGEPGTDRWPTLLFTPGAHPLDQCAARLAALAGGSAVTLHAQLHDDPRALHLTVLQALADQPDDRDLLIVVDQFEEVFTLCADEQERTRFITALLAAARVANSRTRVVLGVRADFYPACSDHPDLVDALRDAQLLVGPMTTDDLRRAVTLPARRAGCAVDSALLARIVADAAGHANVLPLVSHALRETWQRRRGNTLALAGYEAAGGIQHALARTAETVYAGLTAAQQRLTRDIFLRLVALGEGTEDTKRRVGRDELDADGVHPVLDALAAARLVTLDTDTVEITHEALLHAWPRLRHWLSEDRAGLLIGQQLGEAAAAWHREHRDPAALYRGNRLAAAREWLAGQDGGPLRPGAGVAEFVAASLRQQHRAIRWRRAVVAALCVLTVLASAGAVVAWRQRSTALAERDQAIAGRVTAEAEQLAGIDVSLAAQLYLAAYRLHPAPDSYTGLLNSENVALSTPLTGNPDTVYAVAYSPKQPILASGGKDSRVRLWSVADPAHPIALATLSGHSDRVYWVAFSPDGRTLATASRDRTARLWNVADPAHPNLLATLSGHDSYVYSVSFSPDGRTLATAGQDRTVRLWDVTDPAHPTAGPVLAGHTDAVASATFSPDRHTLVSVGHDRTVRLWDVTDPAHPAPGAVLTGHTDTVYEAAFTPDGHTMATVSNDRSVRLWDLTDPAHPAALGLPLTGHTDTIYTVAFSPDGRTLATAGADQTVRLWNVADRNHPVALGSPLAGHTGYVWALAFSPDGQRLASADGDHTVRLWSLPPTVLTGHTGQVNGVAFSPDRHTLASASTDHTVRLWNVTDPAHPVPEAVLAGHTGAVVGVAFSADGHTLASAGRDRTARLWDVTDPAHADALGAPLTGQNGTISAVAFSPVRPLLATASADHTVALWDVTERTRPVRVGPLLTGHTDYLYAVAFSPDGHLLATASADDTVRLWDVADPAHAVQVGQPINPSSGSLLGVAFDPDRRRHILAITSSDHTVALWNLADPAHPGRLGPPVTGHTSFVYSASFSPDGHTLASSSDDHTVRLWDLADPARPQPVGQPLTGHTEPIDTVAFSGDGHTLATASDDHTVELSALDADRAIDRICATTANVLTAQQWRHYLPELPFRPSCR